MTINWPARRQRAVVFLAQPLKPGRAWASLTYEYDTEQEHGRRDRVAQDTTA
jgi:hypothetical protein